MLKDTWHLLEWVVFRKLLSRHSHLLGVKQDYHVIVIVELRFYSLPIIVSKAVQCMRDYIYRIKFFKLGWTNFLQPSL